MIKEILNVLYKEFGKEPQFCQPKITIINMLYVPSSFLCLFTNPTSKFSFYCLHPENILLSFKQIILNEYLIFSPQWSLFII